MTKEIDKDLLNSLYQVKACDIKYELADDKKPMLEYAPDPDDFLFDSPRIFKPKEINSVLSEMVDTNGIIPGTIRVAAFSPRDNGNFPLPTQKVHIELEYCNIRTNGQFIGVDKLLVGNGYLEE